MIFKYDTKRINGKLYISGSRLIDAHCRPGQTLMRWESGEIKKTADGRHFVGYDECPPGEYEFCYPLAESLCDENGKLQWTIRENPGYDPKVDRHNENRYIIERDPEPLTAGEIAQGEERAKRNQLVARYPQERITEIQDQAIQALATGKGLPKEYLDYINFKGGIYGKT